MNSQRRLLAALPLCASLATALLPLAGHAEAPSPERGRYIAMTSGCNDCHTAGYMPSAGRVPESDWLKGDTFGWSGAWGTTYAPNLRIFMSRIDEAQWLAYARSAETRPPMPWFGLRAMSDDDLRSIYRYVRSLAPLGDPAPAYLPPGVTPQGPYAEFKAPERDAGSVARIN